MYWSALSTTKRPADALGRLQISTLLRKWKSTRKWILVSQLSTVFWSVLSWLYRLWDPIKNSHQSILDTYNLYYLQYTPCTRFTFLKSDKSNKYLIFWSSTDSWRNDIWRFLHRGQMRINFSIFPELRSTIMFFVPDDWNDIYMNVYLHTCMIVCMYTILMRWMRG